MRESRETEAVKITDLLRGRTVRIARRHRKGELMIEFDDGTCLFVNVAAGDLDFSITGGVSGTV
jgi:hypothetical protein